MKSKFDIELYHRKFRKYAITSFDFLVKKFNFKIFKEGRESYWYSYSIIYKNKTTAVKVGCDAREEGISVSICRLLDGKVPERELFISKKNEIDCYDLDFFFSIEPSSTEKDFPNIYNDETFPPIYDEQTMEKILNEYATALIKYASDFLIGDFTIFPKLEKIAQKRWEEYEKEEKREAQRNNLWQRLKRLFRK